MGYLLLFIFLLVFLIFGGVLRSLASLFRLGKKFRPSSRKEETIYDNQTEAKPKVFNDDEGEYVDFEEITNKEEN